MSLIDAIEFEVAVGLRQKKPKSKSTFSVSETDSISSNHSIESK